MAKSRFLRVRVKGDGEVTPGMEAKAKLAVANCPEHAVRLTNE